MTEQWFFGCETVADKQAQRTACLKAALDYVHGDRNITDQEYENDYLCVVDGVVIKQGTLAECEIVLRNRQQYNVAYINLIEQISSEATYKYFDINSV